MEGGWRRIEKVMKHIDANYGAYMPKSRKGADEGDIIIAVLDRLSAELDEVLSELAEKDGVSEEWAELNSGPELMH